MFYIQGYPPLKGSTGIQWASTIQRFGNATAFSVKNIPGPSFNTVKGLKDGDEKVVCDIIDYYYDREIPVRFELTPAHTSPAFLTYLSEAGFYHTDFQTTLYAGLSSEIKPIDPKITLRRLKKNEFKLICRNICKGISNA